MLRAIPQGGFALWRLARTTRRSGSSVEPDVEHAGKKRHYLYNSDVRLKCAYSVSTLT